MMCAYTVYKHTSPSGKVYIGITSMNPKTRWHGGCGYGMNKYFSNAIKKYGWTNFTHEILYTDMTKTEAEAKEIELIAKYQSTNPEYGYNIEHGGKCKGCVSEETKARLREINTGKTLSEETRRKVGDSLRGKPRPEHVKQILLESKRKPVCQYSLDGTFVKEWYSVMTVERTLGISHAIISKVANGKGHTAGGYVWKYKKE